MSIWRILEIKPTKDKDAIQAAYRAKLMKTHPEDDPEGFMELRRALEAALKEADRPDGDSAENAGAGATGNSGGAGNFSGAGSSNGGNGANDWGDDAVGRWMQQVDQVYRTFSRRKNPVEWKQLLEDDVCINLDTKIEARSRLLRYFMEHYFISQEVMTLLDEHFGFIENMDELAEEFPRNYLDVIIVQGMKRQEYPPYEYLTGDDSCDFDEYLRTGIRLSQALSSGNAEKGFEAVEDMKMMGIDNPFLEIDHAKVLCLAQRFEEAAFAMEELLEEYPEIDDVHLMNGDICFFLEDYDAAAAEYEHVLEKDKKQEWALQGKAKCLMKTGAYKEANEIFSNLVEEYPYDMDTLSWLKECNVQYIAHLKEAIKDSNDQSLLMDLGWCYYQNEEYEQAIALMQYVEPEDEHKIEYESMMGRCSLYADRHAKALKHMQNWEALLRELPPSEENDEKRKTQLPFCLLLQSYAWDKMHETEKSMELAQMAMELDPEDIEPVQHIGQLQSKMWNMEAAAEWFTKAIKMKPEAHTSYVMRARALFHMGYYSDAYNDCEKSLELFPYELAAYVFKIKILIEVGQFDGADELLAYLEGEDLSGSELEFLKGYVVEARGDKEAARKIYQSIIDNPDDKDKDVFVAHDLAEVYHHMAVIQYNTPGATYSQVEELLEKGLEENPRDAQLLEMKAEIAAERKQYTKSLEVYKQLEKTAPGRRGIYGAMDNLYRELDKWEEALECAEKQLEQAPTGYAYMRRGQLYAYMNKNEKAESDFKMAMQLAPELPYPYNYMGVLMESYEREDEALEYYKMAIKTGEQEKDICGEAYHNAANLYMRRNDFVNAERLLNRAYVLTGENNFLYEMITVHRRAGEFIDAEQILKEYCSREGLDTTSRKYSVELAHIYREQGKDRMAFDIYDAASDDNCDAALEAGKILFYKGKYRKALKYMKKSIQLYKAENPSGENAFFLAEFYLWAAKAALEGGNKTEARELAMEGIGLIPEDYDRYESCIPMLEQMLGGMYTILGDYTRAEAHLRRALQKRKCDYCIHGYCIDACYEMIYLCLLTGRREEAMEYLKKGMATDPIDTDFRKIREQIEKGKR